MRHNRTLTEAVRMERFEELYVELEAGRMCEGEGFGPVVHDQQHQRITLTILVTPKLS